MKKNKNGFTLVELMAVVVVLIIVLLIAINKVKDAGHKSHMNAIKSSAISYRNAVRDVVSADLVEEGELYAGIFTIDDLSSYGVKVNGKQPTGGYFVIQDYKITDFCVEYEEAYHLNYSPNDISDVKDGKCDYKISYDKVIDYDYTGDQQTFRASQNGLYFIEAWGAQGGDAYGAAGGKGAYASGYLYLAEGEVLYIYVGGAGDYIYNGLKNGGYNGGGTAYGQNAGSRYWGSGGGATDIRLVGGTWDSSESLASRIMVAGGGGGAFADGGGKYVGGAAGALTGLNGTQWSGDNWCYGEGGTQTSGGRITTNCNRSSSYGNALTGSFGKGGDCSSNCTGGGGGYYGGSRSGHVASAGGGSSYVSGYKGSVAIENEYDLTPKCTQEQASSDANCSKHYSDIYFSNPTIKAGNEKMPNKSGSATVTGNSGHGHARISLISTQKNNSNTTVYAYTGSAQKFTAPSNGTYQIELWGAQGNNPDRNRSYGGKGGYTSGTISLNKGDVLYIYVGQHRSDRAASFNAGSTGGGDTSTDLNGSVNGYGGGGATDVRLVKGSWSSATGLASRIMVAGGGGGALDYSMAADGGYAGGLTGGTAIGGRYESNGAEHVLPTGGTQTSGGLTTQNISYVGQNGSFGLGGNGNSKWGSGGGGGYYGGGGGGYSDYSVDSGAGGSSYISGHTGCVAINSESDRTPKSGCTDGTSDNSCSIHYSNKKFSDTIIKSGNETMPTHDGVSTMVGNSGDGYAKITKLN